MARHSREAPVMKLEKRGKQKTLVPNSEPTLAHSLKLHNPDELRLASKSISGTTVTPVLETMFAQRLPRDVWQDSRMNE